MRIYSFDVYYANLSRSIAVIRIIAPNIKKARDMAFKIANENIMLVDRKRKGEYSKKTSIVTP